jgi:hypothetical protein
MSSRPKTRALDRQAGFPTLALWSLSIWNLTSLMQSIFYYKVDYLVSVFVQDI